MQKIVQTFILVGVFIVGGLGLSGFDVNPKIQHGKHQKWELLGRKKVSYGLDRDVIKVGRNEGGFKKLKVIVHGGGVNMHKMVVVYGNGNRDQITLRHNFRKGSDSRIIDLNGGKRKIKEIIFWYDTKNISRRRGSVSVFGKH